MERGCFQDVHNSKRNEQSRFRSSIFKIKNQRGGKRKGVKNAWDSSHIRDFFKETVWMQLYVQDTYLTWAWSSFSTFEQIYGNWGQLSPTKKGSKAEQRGSRNIFLYDWWMGWLDFFQTTKKKHFGGALLSENDKMEFFLLEGKGGGGYRFLDFKVLRFSYKKSWWP